jgi:hypothetical protein
MSHTSLALALALAVCVTASASAQSAMLSGTVIDDRTGQPLKGVLIYIENQSEFAETDADGRFTLALAPGQYTLAVSLIGYALQRSPATVRAGAPQQLTIRLSEGAGSFTDRVVVTGDRRTQGEEAPGGGALYGRELQNLRGVMLDDPLRAVQALPAATATDDFYSEFAVRGDSFRHVNLTVDGIGARFLMHTVNDVSDGGSIAMVNSETLGAVTLLPGSYPQHAGRRLGAQVDLLTREGTRDRVKARAGLSGTSATILAEGPLADKRGSWLVSARRSYLDYLIKRIDPEASFAFGFIDAQAKLVYDLTPRHQLQVLTLFGRAAFNEDAPDLSINDEATATSRASFTSLSWRYTPSPRWSTTQRLYSTGLRFTNENPSGAALSAGRANQLGWRTDNTVALSDRYLIEFGADAERLAGRHSLARALSASSPLTPLGAYDEHSSAASAYGQVRIAFPKFTITPGARADYWGITDVRTVSPWINAEIPLGRATKVRAGTGRFQQFADFEQAFGLNRGGRALLPERALHVDVGVERTIVPGTTLQVTAYTRSEGDVLWVPGDAPRRTASGTVDFGRFDAPWVNALDGRARGVELLMRRESPSGLSGWAGYAYSRLRYDDPARGESFWANADQRHTLSLYGNYRLSSKTTTSAKYRYGSNYPLNGYFATDPSAPVDTEVDRPAYYTLASERNRLRLPAYSRLDVRMDHAFNWTQRRLVLFVEVANVLNHKNLRNTPYGFNNAGRVFGAEESLMPIVPSAGFVVEF